MNIKNMKFRVSSKEESAALQAWLFTQGYIWAGSGENICHEEARYILAESSGSGGCGGWLSFTNSDAVFNDGDGKSYLEMKLITKVKTTVECALPAESIVEINGSIFRVEDILKNITPVA